MGTSEPCGKDTNPKEHFGANKVPLHLWPATATALGSLALLDGALQYGRGNYKAAGARASTYIAAAQRHLALWDSGQELDTKSGLPHLAHILACIAILVDCQAAGNLEDDRQFPTNYAEFIESLTPHVSRLKKLHENKNPKKHYTIQDHTCAGQGIKVEA